VISRHRFWLIVSITALTLLMPSLLPTPGVAQDAQSDRRPNKKRKQRKPFRWVNPLPEKWNVPGLRHETFASQIAGRRVGYLILLPPEYPQSDQRYPVVYYLHGGRPGDETRGAKIAESIARIRTQNPVDPAIYVLVNGGPVSHYNVPDRIGIDGQPDARGADVFVDELIPHIDATYRTKADRRFRGLIMRFHAGNFADRN